MARRRQTAAARHRAFLNANRHLYPDLFEIQGGGCALCGKPPKNRKLDLDHHHKDMVIRGLLCVRCNRNLHDWMTVEWAEALVEYLRNPPANQLSIV
jgi:hypothetical protein